MGCDYLAYAPSKKGATGAYLEWPVFVLVSVDTVTYMCTSYDYRMSVSQHKLQSFRSTQRVAP